jgi:hypothetical protein
MPQAQSLAGCKAQSATEPCRLCHVQQGADLGDVNFAAAEQARVLWEVRADRAAVASKSRSSLADAGLAVNPSPLETAALAFDTTRQIPPEPLHAELLGISLLTLSLLCGWLTGRWLNALSAILSNMTTPWSTELPTLVLSRRGRIKLDAEQVCRAVQLLPFALSWPRADRITDWLEPGMFSATARLELQDRLGSTFCSAIREAFVALAQSNATIFTDERPSGTDWLADLQQNVNAARETLCNVFGDTMNRPNTHTTVAHIADSADMFAVPKNFDVRTLETKHGAFRRFIARSNNRFVERQIIDWANVKQAMHYLARGGELNPALAHLVPDNVLEALHTDPVFDQLLERVPTSDLHGGHDAGGGRGSDKPTWTGLLQGLRLCAAEAALCVVATRKATAYMKVTLPGRPAHLTIVRAGDVWEVWEDRLPSTTNRAPRGPRPGVSLVRVHSVWAIGQDVWTRVEWYRTTGAVQLTTQCRIFTGPQAAVPGCDSLLPLDCLIRRAHILQHGPLLLHNKYFIK